MFLDDDHAYVSDALQELWQKQITLGKDSATWPEIGMIPKSMCPLQFFVEYLESLYK